MKAKLKVGDLVKMKLDRLYVHHWRNPDKFVTLPVAGIITDIKTQSWVHPYYGMSKHFEQKEIQAEIATINWFEYQIPGFGKSDEFNLTEYNKNFKQVPLKRLVNFNKYLAALKKKKGLYK